LLADGTVTCWGDDSYGQAIGLPAIVSWPYTHGRTSDFTLYARWTLVVTLDTQGGSIVSDASTTSGGTVTDPGTPTRVGYTFDGWYAAASGGSAITFPYGHGRTSDFTLYAQWTANTLTVTTDEQGGTAIGDASTTTGASMLSPGTPTRAGYTFTGWYALASGGSEITFPYGHGRTSDFTLYAQWTANSLTVTYDSGGGSSITATSTTSGGSVADPGVPTRAGYQFAGWYTAASEGSAIATGSAHSCALLAGGTVTCWGENSYGQATVPAGITSATAISAGGYHSCALLDGGTVTCWGDDYRGQASVPAGITTASAISAGEYHTCALLDGGTVTCWGATRESHGQTSVPAGITTATAISAGEYHTCALLDGGTVTCWGYGVYGQTSVPAGITTATAISAGYLHSCALLDGGTVTCWR
jgi:uncharacterized repeat protein (TIGR02543 family)